MRSRESVAASFATRGRPAVPPVRGDHDMNPDLRPDGPLRRAAVLVPLVERAAGLTVLLTQRAAHLSSHAGQISFPGGRIEDDDPTPDAAALREAWEEVGLPPDLVSVVGRLDTYVTRTGFEIVPIVGLVSPPAAWRLQASEVAEAFEVPLDFVADRSNHERHSRIYDGRERFFWVLPYERRYIWGATAGMLVDLAQVLAEGTGA